MPAADETANGWQHARTGLIRGVENGFGVAWAARTGTLMISDGLGRVVAEANTGGLDSFTTLVADVPPGPGATSCSWPGDWFAWLCLVLVLVGLGAVVRVRRQSETVSPPSTTSV